MDVNMEDVELIDVTLRDGGYKTNFHFETNVLENILTNLDRSGIEYIEIGYRNGPIKPTKNMGDAGYCTNAYIEHCTNIIHHAKTTVMVHPNNVNKKDFDEMESVGVRAVRICFNPNHKEAEINILKILKDYQFDVFVNLVRVSQHDCIQICEWVHEISSFHPKAIYLADSNGGMIPSRIETIISFLTEKTCIPIGFHAHDNLFLAQANAIAALDGGAKYLDGSLYGLGKGGGNLRTEMIAAYLHGENGPKYDLCSLLNTAQSMSNMINVPLGHISTKDIIHGIYNLSQDDIGVLDDFVDAHTYLESARKYSETRNLQKKSDRNGVM